MIGVEKEDLDELARLLDPLARFEVLLQESDEREEMIHSGRRALQAFHTTAAMLGLDGLARVGLELEDYMSKFLEPNGVADPEAVALFSTAAGSLMESVRGGSFLDMEPSLTLEGIVEILQPEHKITNPMGAGITEGQLESQGAVGSGGEDPGETVLPELAALQRTVEAMGGRVTVNNGSQGEESFQLCFPLSPANLDRLHTLLSPCNPSAQFAPGLNQQDSRIEKVLRAIKDFMSSLSAGKMGEAQEVLLLLAEQHPQTGLYTEIGIMARELHNSLKNFMSSLDPALKDFVEEKLPDSGNRLEHILKLTEKAANTTLDHVESMQMRNQQDQSQLSTLQELLRELRPIGGNAQERLVECQRLIRDVQASLAQTNSDLITVLTAQDYQDLSGQIILKIIQLLKDLELKLVNVIRTFGLRPGEQKANATEELYGPVHEGKTEALHSQDDVDSLLAEFGF